MIVQIRGASGSGKSTLARHWLDAYPARPLYGVFGTRKPEGYRCLVPGLTRPLYVLGSYETTCGGADTVQPYALILNLISKYAARGHVLFEGLLSSGTYGAVGELLDALTVSGVPSVIVLLSTPVEECIERVKQRRLRRGNQRPYNPQNLIAAHASCIKTRERFAQNNSAVRWLELAPEETNARIMELLERFQNSPRPYSRN